MAKMKPTFVHRGLLLGKNQYGDLERRNNPRMHYYPANIYKQEAQMEIGSDIVRYQVPRYTGPISIYFVWHEPPAANKNGRNTGNRRDIDNIGAAKKFVLDAMVAKKVIKDDSLEYVRETHDCAVIEPFGAPYGVEIYIREIGESSDAWAR
jgi:Holliday junction resolvase RusA-like endonuclease